MLYQFEGHLLDPSLRELRRGTDAIRVEPQVFDLLHYLVAHRARAVAKGELLDTIWPNRVVSEATLNSRINAARAAIGDNGRDQRLIRTLRTKGFRFVGSVSELPKASFALGSINHRRTPIGDRPAIAIIPLVNMDGGLKKERG